MDADADDRADRLVRALYRGPRSRMGVAAALSSQLGLSIDDAAVVLDAVVARMDGDGKAATPDGAEPARQPGGDGTQP